MATTDASHADDPRPRYVVGVDGSDASVAGLAWAIERAATTGAHIEAVAMWHFPPLGLERPSVGEKLHAATIDMLDDAVTRARALRSDVDETDVEISTAVYQYPAADRLIDLSENADLVIVGRRTTHPFGTLGSVSARVASHAHCPVVVIPNAPEPSSS